MSPRTGTDKPPVSKGERLAQLRTRQKEIEAILKDNDPKGINVTFSNLRAQHFSNRKSIADLNGKPWKADDDSELPGAMKLS